MVVIKKQEEKQRFSSYIVRHKTPFVTKYQPLYVVMQAFNCKDYLSYCQKETKKPN